MTPQLVQNAGVSIACSICRHRTLVDPRHLDNLTAAGPWRCTSCKDKDTE